MDTDDIYKSPEINIVFFNNMKGYLKEQLELYNKLSCHLTNINVLKSINNIECDFILKYNNNVSNTNSKVNILIEQINLIDNYIKNYCNHEWVIDNIDTDIDKSVLISYCNICHTTK